MLTLVTAGASANPLIPTSYELVATFIGLMFLGLIIAAVVVVLRSEHTTVTKALMLLLCFLVPLLGAICALVLAARKPEHLRRSDNAYA